MWVRHKTLPNLIVAEAWKEFCEEGGVPCRLWWPDPSQRGDAIAPCDLYVPNDRMHVVEFLVSNC